MEWLIASLKIDDRKPSVDQSCSADGETALTDWLSTTGGSLVGLHAGSACLFEDQAFGTALGSWFDYHPDLQNVVRAL